MTEDQKRFIDSAHELAETMRSKPMTPTKELIAGLRALAENLGRHPGAEVASAAADRLDALTAPVEGMTPETTEDERAMVRKRIDALKTGGRPTELALFTDVLLRDFDRLSSALAAERAGKERLAGALRDAVSLLRSTRGDAPDEWIAALSQEKQP